MTPNITHEGLVQAMSLDTKELFRGNTRAVTYNEAVEELREAYDVELGLNTGNCHVVMSDYENPLHDTLYEKWGRIYQDADIYKHWKMDFNAWIAQPRWKMEIQIRIAEDRARVEEQIAKEISAENNVKKGT